MSKGLEAYEIVKEECGYAFGGTANGDRVRENLPIIEKELKAFEIIKKYIYVDKPYGIACYIYLNDESEMIPDEEYDLLKEVLL